MNETSGVDGTFSVKEIFRLQRLATDAINDLSGMAAAKGNQKTLIKPFNKI